MGSRAAPHRSTTAASSARVEHLVHGDRAAVTDRHDARARRHGSGQHVVLPVLSFTDPCTIGRDPPPSIHRSPALRGELRQARDTRRRSGADGSAVRRPTGVSARRSPGTLGSKERPAWFATHPQGPRWPPHFAAPAPRARSLTSEKVGAELTIHDVREGLWCCWPKERPDDRARARRCGGRAGRPALRQVAGPGADGVRGLAERAERLGEVFVALTRDGVQFVRSAESVDGDPEASTEVYRRRFARPAFCPSCGRRGAAPPLDLSGRTTFERTVLSVTRSIAGETRPQQPGGWSRNRRWPGGSDRVSRRSWRAPTFDDVSGAAALDDPVVCLVAAELGGLELAGEEMRLQAGNHAT